MLLDAWTGQFTVKWTYPVYCRISSIPSSTQHMPSAILSVCKPKRLSVSCQCPFCRGWVDFHVENLYKESYKCLQMGACSSTAVEGVLWERIKTFWPKAYQFSTPETDQGSMCHRNHMIQSRPQQLTVQLKIDSLANYFMFLFFIFICRKDNWYICTCFYWALKSNCFSSVKNELIAG